MTRPINPSNPLVQAAAQDCLEMCHELKQALRVRVQQIQSFDRVTIEQLEQANFLKGIASRIESDAQSLEEIGKVQTGLTRTVEKGRQHFELRNHELARLNEHNRRLEQKLRNPPKDNFALFLQEFGEKCSDYLTQGQHGS
jgi:urease alpha subunit